MFDSPRGRCCRHFAPDESNKPICLPLRDRPDRAVRAEVLNQILDRLPDGQQRTGFEIGKRSDEFFRHIVESLAAVAFGLHSWIEQTYSHELFVEIVINVCRPLGECYGQRECCRPMAFQFTDLQLDRRGQFERNFPQVNRPPFSIGADHTNRSISVLIVSFERCH
ncbi:hypothetical protein [Planctopirus hydrillae]|nr:hypothetical protein [Planctopirus hydrillae]